MQVSVESTSNIGRKMTVSVPAEKVDGEVEKRLKNMRGRVKLDGFRPGKVPLSVVSQQYGDSVYEEVVGEIFQSSFNEAAVAEGLRVAGYPTIDPQVIGAGKDLEYTATFDIYPQVKIGNIEALVIPKVKVEITEIDINQMIEKLQEQQKEWRNVERVAKKDDLVVISFDGTINGETFEGGSAKDFSVEVGSGRMLKEFDDALVGVSANDEKEFDVTFPQEYPAAEIKGKTAQFVMKVSAVREATFPVIDKAFMKKFGIEDGTEEIFRAEIKNNMLYKLNQNIKIRLKQSVMNSLDTLHEIDIPDFLVTEEVNHVREEMASNNEGADLSSLPDDLFIKKASRRVKLGLIAGEIITSNNLQKDPRKVDEMLNMMAVSYEDHQAFIDDCRSNEQTMQTVEAAVMEEMIVDWVLEKATVIDEGMSFSELMSPEPQAEAIEVDDTVATEKESTKAV